MKLPLQDKIFWKNFLYFVLIFAAATFLLGYAPENDGRFGFMNGYIVTSFLCVLYLGYKISMDLAK